MQHSKPRFPLLGGALPLSFRNLFPTEMPALPIGSPPTTWNFVPHFFFQDYFFKQVLS